MLTTLKKGFITILESVGNIKPTNNWVIYYKISVFYIFIIILNKIKLYIFRSHQLPEYFHALK